MRRPVRGEEEPTSTQAERERQAPDSDPLERLEREIAELQESQLADLARQIKSSVLEVVERRERVYRRLLVLADQNRRPHDERSEPSHRPTSKARGGRDLRSEPPCGGARHPSRTGVEERARDRGPSLRIHSLVIAALVALAFAAGARFLTAMWAMCRARRTVLVIAGAASRAPAAAASQCQRAAGAQGEESNRKECRQA